MHHSLSLAFGLALHFFDRTKMFCKYFKLCGQFRIILNDNFLLLYFIDLAVVKVQLLQCWVHNFVALQVDGFRGRSRFIGMVGQLNTSVSVINHFLNDLFCPWLIFDVIRSLNASYFTFDFHFIRCNQFFPILRDYFYRRVISQVCTIVKRNVIIKVDFEWGWERTRFQRFENKVDSLFTFGLYGPF